MKRVRLRMFDVNGQRGSYAVNCKDAVDWGVANAIMTAYNACVRPAMSELALMQVQQLAPTDPGSGATPLVKDIAVLTFTTNGPFGLQVPLLGPGDIFLDDDVTVNPDNADVAYLIANIESWCTDKVGQPVIQFVKGRRVGAGGP